MEKKVKGIEQRLKDLRKQWQEDCIVTILLTQDQILLKSCVSIFLPEIENEGEDSSHLDLNSKEIISPFPKSKINYFG